MIDDIPWCLLSPTVIHLHVFVLSPCSMEALGGRNRSNNYPPESKLFQIIQLTIHHVWMGISAIDEGYKERLQEV